MKAVTSTCDSFLNEFLADVHMSTSVFDLDMELNVPPALISFIRLLQLSEEAWENVRDKGKPPKPKIDAEILENVKQVLEQRMREYQSDLQVSCMWLTWMTSTLTINLPFPRRTNQYLKLLFH
jgi:N-lysine methyltransferase SETD6